MDSHIKVAVSIVSHRGINGFNNNDDFYINGRHKYEYETENTAISVEKSLPEHIFALCGDMDKLSHEKKSSISMVKELGKFQEKIKGIGGDLESKLTQLAECATEINNVIFSMSLGEQSNRQTAAGFAALFFSDRSVGALNTTDSRIYLLRDSELRQMTGDRGKAERLLRAGIITKEQVKVLSGRLGMPANSYGREIQKSSVIEVKEGDMFLLCSDEIGSILGDEAINDILTSCKEIEYISHALIKQALDKGAQEALTVLVVKVDGIGVEGSKTESDAGQYFDQEPVRLNGSTRHSNAWAYIAAAIICVVVAGILINTYYKLWFGSPEGMQDDIPAYVSSQDNTADTGEAESTAVRPENQEPTQPEGENNSNGNGVGDVAENDASTPVTYTVQDGDTLQKISKKFYNDAQKYTIIMEKNNIKDENKLKVGQKLIIP